MVDRGIFPVVWKPFHEIFVVDFLRIFVIPFLLLSWVYQASASVFVPVIGVLSQPVYDGGYQYIAASYVKWIESAGAAAIVIPYDADEYQTREIFSQINGVLFPGGGNKRECIAKYVPTI